MQQERPRDDHDDRDAVRIVFMGTPRFAVPALQALLALPEIAGKPARIVTVVTQPDRPAGRGGHVRPGPVKEIATGAGVPVWQPQRLRRAENVATLAALRPDLIVVAAFAQILSPDVLAIPRYGCLNVHASLLPRWRGADPIRAAILAGDDTSGVTIMLMDVGLDTGPILAQRQEPIMPDDTGGSLEDRLAGVGATLLAETAPAWIAGRLTAHPQDERLVTMTRPLRRDDGLIDWLQDSVVLARQVRAYCPWPGTATTWNGRLLKVLAAHAGEGSAPPGLVLDEHVARRAAAQAGLAEPAIAAGTGRGLLLITRLQIEGKRQMSAAEFLAGYRVLQGATLGTAA